MSVVDQCDDNTVIGFVDAGDASARELAAGETSKNAHRGELDTVSAAAV
jgi:hypothetical protein